VSVLLHDSGVSFKQFKQSYAAHTITYYNLVIPTVAAFNGTINLSQLPRRGPRLDPIRQSSSSTIDSRVRPRTRLPLGVLGTRWEGGAAEELVLGHFAER